MDLGLSVKWASCNIGSRSESDTGDFFAWGEVSPKENYSLPDYRFRVSGEKTGEVRFSKYITIKSHGNRDGKCILEPSDDAAHVLWGNGWRMPTSKEMDQLVKKCDWIWGEKNGVKGYTVRSRTNGNSIFLPIGGFRYDRKTVDSDRFGYYWTSAINSTNEDISSILMFYKNEYRLYVIGRSAGCLIRPVKDL